MHYISIVWPSLVYAFQVHGVEPCNALRTVVKLATTVLDNFNTSVLPCKPVAISIPIKHPIHLYSKSICNFSASDDFPMTSSKLERSALAVVGTAHSQAVRLMLFPYFMMLAEAPSWSFKSIITLI